MAYLLEEMLNPDIKKSLQDLRDVEDDVLLEVYDRAQKHTRTATKDYNMDFSYTSILQEIKRRGYIQRWVKEHPNPEDSKRRTEVQNKENVKIKVQEQKCRKNISMTKSCYKEFDEFLKGKRNAYIYCTAALRLFMKMYKEGRVGFEIDPY